MLDRGTNRWWRDREDLADHPVRTGPDGAESHEINIFIRNTPEDLQQVETDDWTILYTHDQQTYEREWWLGMALILPKDSYLGYGRAPEEGRFTTSFFGKIDLNKQPITYYAIGC